MRHKVQRGIWLFVVVGMALFASGPKAGAASSLSGDPVPVPAPGMVTVLDLGAKSCIPCKMMAPVLENLAHKYEGKAAIVFIDVWQHPEQTERFGIRAIPTQIFYDASGKEIMRHEGFFSQESIEKVLARLGVQ
ncbi:MAG: Thioredoxin domain protein [Desulfomicrobiaceae bacterium]|jgi:thioredoxin 1|nr:Thioredoxin domain protein [Desulfomicrobiaceae bacterium]